MESRSDLLSTLDPGSHGDEQGLSELLQSGIQSSTATSSLAVSSPVIDDTITIAYQGEQVETHRFVDHFEAWPQAECLFKYLTRFDLKLSRNLKLESLNGQLKKGTGHEDLHVTVKCQYVGLPAGKKTQDAAEGHRCCKGKEKHDKYEGAKSQEEGSKGKEDADDHGGSDYEVVTKEDEEEAREEVEPEVASESPEAYSGDADHHVRADESLPMATKDANYPYLHLFLVPPSSLSDYKEEIKPRMKEFIATRMENKLNEEFLIVAFLNKSGASSSEGSREGVHRRKSKLGLSMLTGGKEGEDRKVLEKMRMRLFRHKLRSRLVVVTLDAADNAGNKHAEPVITNAIKESGIDKMMRTLLNLSLNKRYLYILINVNKMFLPFISASTAGANARSGAKVTVASGENGESAVNKEGVPANTASVGSGISALTVGNYLQFVEALENLCNLFYKIQLTLESVVLYEFLLYNEHFGKMLSMFKAAKVDEEFYRSYNVLNSYSSAYYSTLSQSRGSASGGLAGADDAASVAKYCYVRYRLYILSKQLLMLNTITTNTQDLVGGERVSRATTSALEGVVTMPSSANVGTNAPGPFENLLFLPVVLTYNFINDVYFQVIGTSALPSYPAGTMVFPEGGESVIPAVEGVSVTASGGAVRRIKWLMLTTIELIRHLENKLNSELLDDASTDDNYLGEVVRGKKKKFRFLKSIFKTGSSSSSSKGSGQAKGSSTGATASGSISWVVKSYYGIKVTENPYKYVSFIYLVLYKLVLQLASAKSGGSTTVTAAAEGPKYDEEGLEVYIDSMYENCIRLHYANITADKRGEESHCSAANPDPSGVSSAGSLMRTIDQMLDQIVDYKVAIIERCSRYFVLSNLQSYSNVLRSYYLRPNASAQALEGPESTLGGEETDRTTESDWPGKAALQIDLRTETLLNTDTTNADTSRTLTTERSTSSVSTGRLDKERGPERSITVKRSVAPGVKTITEMLQREHQKGEKQACTIRDTRDSDGEEGQQGERRVQCSLSNCNEYDHLFNKSFKRSSVKTLSLYPSCYNYVHVHLTKKAAEKLEGQLYLHMSTVRSDVVAALSRGEGAGKLARGAEGSMLEVDMSGMAVINLDNKVVNIALGQGQPGGVASSSSAACGGASGGSMGAIKLPNFTTRMIVCVPLKLCDPTLAKKEGRTGTHCGISNTTCADLTNSGAVKAGLRLNISLTNTSTVVCGTASASPLKSEGAAAKGSISASTTNAVGGKSYPVKVREIFDLRMSEAKGMKNIHVKVLYRDLVKIHQIYLNNNIIAEEANLRLGTTLLDHDSIYKIAYQPSQSTTATTPTNLMVNVGTADVVNLGTADVVTAVDRANSAGKANANGNANDNVNVGNPDRANGNANDNGKANEVSAVDAANVGNKAMGMDLIKIYYSLYRKYRSSLQQLTHNQLYLIDPASLQTVDSENAFGSDDKDEEEEETPEGTGESGKGTSREEGTESGARGQESGQGEQLDRTEAVEADLVMKVPGYAFVSRPINVALHLLSRESTSFSYSIESNESWFIEGLVVNNNVQLTEEKQHKLQFRLIPLREGRLEVPTVKFRGVKVEVPRREVTVFPANYLLL
ncbi:conserved hypothetical protein [Theileria orientalis strain Shintoku]|uniref:TRAPPC10/Trs130 C-terminal domain-containing protein n=1 Tax=Theileria orientalis strain Shintoku TaxID=869250 RepID=J4D885_THEOR|nr:conserved hypothetical protein [Theileria orientalis strain Shintoku]BAM40635.1 conserved hypothetical protein [Theileria orientalis strain Shintoku]|eukprot:XP_009690936.1 conserved hypothetical protein [Theileria orientalis strain Shintoku]